MNPVPNFDVKEQFPAAQLISGLQRKAEIENQQKVDEYTRSQELIKQTIQQASGVVTNMVQASKVRQQKEFVQSLADSLAAKEAITPGSSPAPLFSKSANGTRTNSWVPTASFDPNKSDAVRAAVMMNPQEASKDYLKSQLSDPKLPSIQTKSILYNGKPFEALFNPKTSTFHDPVTKQPLTGDIKPFSTGSPYAEIRRQSLIAQLNDRMSKKMIPANWTAGTLAGKSAALVANSDSAIGLANQMLNKEVPITSQNMASLAADASRVLAQSGQPSDAGRKELMARTGQSDFAKALQYFTNKPEDQKLDGFVEILKKEMARQREQRQQIVDRSLAGEFASLNQLKRLSPEDWEAQVVANGFDLETAKKGHLKIRPDVGSTMYGWDIGTSNKAPTFSGGSTDLGNGFSYTVK